MISTSFQENGQPQAVVVLGCRVQAGVPGPALQRRLLEAAQLYEQNLCLPVVMSGGRKWDEKTESAAMAAWWREHRGTGENLFEENDSLTTRQNAHYVARLSRTHDWNRILLVTCDFHMARASQLFEAEGISVIAQPARHERSRLQRFRLALREWGARKLNAWEPPLR